MILVLCSSDDSIGSQMHNGRTDLLFPTTHPKTCRQSSFVDRAGRPHGIFQLAKARQFGWTRLTGFRGIR